MEQCIDKLGDQLRDQLILGAQVSLQRLHLMVLNGNSRLNSFLPKQFCAT